MDVIHIWSTHHDLHTLVVGKDAFQMDGTDCEQHVPIPGLELVKGVLSRVAA